VQISAKADYALRALCVLAAAPEGGVVKADVIAEAQGVPRTFLDQILLDLRRAGVVESRRGPEGGHRLARPPFAITLADVVRVIDGPLALVHGHRPEALAYDAPAQRLQDVWVAVRAALRVILEKTTLEQVVEDRLPSAIRALTGDERSWTSVWPPPPVGPPPVGPPPVGPPPAGAPSTGPEPPPG
jgi:Rrf2 family protein